MRAVVLALVMGITGCASANDAAPSEPNCEDFALMQRGIVSCEQAGEQCAYSRDETTGLGAPVALGSASTHWVCTCDPRNVGLMLFWCLEQ